MTDVAIEPANSSDLSTVLGLLATAGLPTAGVAESFPEGYAVARRDGEVIGVAGLEIYGAGALLRSVVIAATERGNGLARRLVTDRQAEARARGATSVYLLTTSAGAYFPRLGFEPTSRSDVPPALQQSAEFASICPSSAVCLVKHLG